MKDIDRWALLILVIVFAIAFLFGTKAYSNRTDHARKVQYLPAQLNPHQCEALGRFAENAATIRDFDASKEKYWAAVRDANKEYGPEVLRILKEALDRVYAMKDNPTETGLKIYLACMAKQGKGV